MSSLTSANAIIMLSVAGIIPIPQQLQEFAVDDVFDTAEISAGETAMGVDGVLSAGFVFESVKQGYTLQGNSLSNAIFDNWYNAEVAAREKFPAFATIVLPAIGIKYSMIKGWLKTYKPMSDAKKILQPRKHMIEWERAQPSAA